MDTIDRRARVFLFLKGGEHMDATGDLISEVAGEEGGFLFGRRGNT